jgi:hypothetical protein
VHDIDATSGDAPVNPRGELLALAAEDRHVRTELVAQGTLFDGYHPRMEAVHRHNGAYLAAVVLLTLALAMQAHASTRPAHLGASDTTTVVVTKPTVIAYLVIPEGAVDSLPDVAVLADDWNVAMATLGDSLAAHRIAFALVTETHLRVRSAGRRDVVLRLDAQPAAGYVYARPGAPPRLRRGAKELHEVLAAAHQLKR